MAETKSFDEFGAAFQKKIVQAIISDKTFAEQMYEVLDVNFFGLKYLRTIVSKYFDYYSKYTNIPSFSILVTIVRDEIGNDGEERILKSQILDYLKEVKDNPLNGDLEYVKERALEFCRRMKLKDALLESIDKIEKSDYDSIVSIVKHAVELGGEKNLGHDYAQLVDLRLTEEKRDAIPTGFKVLDDKNVLNGGLAKGEIGIIAANTGVGKSMMMCILAANAMRLGKNVLYYTLELSEKDIGKRFDANFTNIHQNELCEYKNIVRDAVGKIPGRLYIKFFPTKSVGVQALRSHMTRLAIRNFIPDIIFVDYADIMKGSRHLNEKRLEIESIYEDLRGLAGEMQIPVYTASQTHRCLFLHTLVDTPDGKKRVCDLKVGDFVLSHSGFNKVSHIWPIIRQPAYKITTENGRSIICSAQHMFPQKYGKLKSIETGLIIGDELYVKK